MKNTWQRKNIVSFDNDTGEILDGNIIWANAKIKWKEGFFMGIQDSFIALAKDKEINGGTMRVLNYLLGRLGFENYICIQQKEISEELDIKKTHVSASVKLLLQKGIILPGAKLGRTTSYKLNDKYGYKGQLVNLKKERERRQQQEQKQANIEAKKITEDMKKEILSRKFTEDKNTEIE